MKIIQIQETDSTNNWVAQHEEELESPSLVYTLIQTSGRGQRGNTWESEPGKNITASLLFYPENYPASSQFTILEAIALAITDYLREEFVEAKVKWPNDIYVGDMKISGTLVEHVILGKNITRTIAGFGINLNQKEFYSDAPNPVSLCHITGEEYDLHDAVGKLALHLEKYLHKLNEKEWLHKNFIELLWRSDELYHKFYDRKNQEFINARIHSLAPDGILTLVTDGGELRDYAFKEVEYIH